MISLASWVCGTLQCVATGMRQFQTFQAPSEDPAMTALCCLLRPEASAFLQQYMPKVDRPADGHASQTTCYHSDMLDCSFQLRSCLSGRIRMRAVKLSHALWLPQVSCRELVIYKLHTSHVAIKHHVTCEGPSLLSSHARSTTPLLVVMYSICARVATPHPPPSIMHTEHGPEQSSFSNLRCIQQESEHPAAIICACVCLSLT